MRFLEGNEIAEWCAGRGIALEAGETRPAADPLLVHAARVLYANGERSGREPAIAGAAVRALGPWDECLLWVTLVGVWPSGEDWPAYYAMRGAEGERRSLDVAPGHWFGRGEAGKLTGILTAVMENGWDAHVLPAQDGRATEPRLRVSHDEWIEIQARAPVEFDAPTA